MCIAFPLQKWFRERVSILGLDANCMPFYIYFICIIYILIYVIYIYIYFTSRANPLNVLAKRYIIIIDLITKKKEEIDRCKGLRSRIQKCTYTIYII